MKAVVPVGEPEDALRFQLLGQPRAHGTLHGSGVGRLVPEQPGQVERLEFLRPEGCELCRGRRQHLHGAELQRLDLLLVLVQRGVRIDFDADFAIRVLFGELLELQRALSFWGIRGHDVAEFDVDLRLRHRRARGHRGRTRQQSQKHQFTHVLFPPRVIPVAGAVGFCSRKAPLRLCNLMPRPRLGRADVLGMPNRGN